MKLWWFKYLAGLGVAGVAGCALPPPAPAPLAAPAVAEAVSRKPAPVVQAKPVELPPLVPLTAMDAPQQPSTVQILAYDPAFAGVPWKQRGVASWYGKKFNGRRTASGERFNASDLTAAHRTLPIPSYVRVRRVANGQEVIVRVNDRGPFHSTRILDLSLAAAQKLGFVSMGSAEVEIERLTPDELPVGN